MADDEAAQIQDRITSSRSETTFDNAAPIAGENPTWFKSQKTTMGTGHQTLTARIERVLMYGEQGLDSILANLSL